ncbi:hypothetical protein, partial [Nocardia heshunensis]
MAKIIIKIAFNYGCEQIEVASIEAMEEIIARRNNFIRAFHFKHSEVIRKDTGTARSHVNTGTWN